MRLQIVAVGLPLVCFAWLGPWLVALLFGRPWMPVMTVFPFVALGALTNAAFNLHSSALYVRRHNLDVSLFHAVHILLFAGGAWWLLPRLGIVGYGWAEAVALLSYAVAHHAFARRFASPGYGAALALWLALALALFRQLGPASWLGLAAIALWPGTWRQLGATWASLRGERA
jgi:PST family polysaccharide transporter